MSVVNTELGQIEQQRAAHGSSTFGKPTEAGQLIGQTGAARFGWGAGGAPVGVPRFGDGFVPGAKPASVLPPERPSGLPRTSTDDIRAALGGGKIEAVVSAPVTATLTGSAEVSGTTTANLHITLDNSPTISRIERLETKVNGALRAIASNGRGSVGTSSPDSGAGIASTGPAP